MSKYVPCPKAGNPCGSKTRLQKNVDACPKCSADRRQARIAAAAALERKETLGNIEAVEGNWLNHFSQDNIVKMEFLGDDEEARVAPEIVVGDSVPNNQLENTKLHVTSQYGGTLSIDTDEGIDVDEIAATLHDGYVDLSGGIKANKIFATASGDSYVDLFDVDCPGCTIFAGNHRPATPSILRDVRAVGDRERGNEPVVAVDGGELRGVGFTKESTLEVKASEVKDCNFGRAASADYNGWALSDYRVRGSTLSGTDFLGESSRSVNVENSSIQDSAFIGV